jgi:hypothetical protein
MRLSVIKELKNAKLLVQFLYSREMMLGDKADAPPKRGTMSPDSAQRRLLISLST